tara:strand:- start:3032 stop:4231 length:1200 start_codon:yes stop_codon:yes gene_type:complete
MINYKQKYLKYKLKYQKLHKKGGMNQLPYLLDPICCNDNEDCEHLSCDGPKMNCSDGQKTCIKKNHFIVSGHGGMINGMKQENIDILKKNDSLTDHYFLVDPKYNIVSLGNVGQCTVSGKLDYINELYLRNTEISNKMTLELGNEERLQIRGPTEFDNIGITTDLQKRKEKHVINNQLIDFENVGKDPGGIFPLPLYYEQNNNNLYFNKKYTLQDLFSVDSKHNLPEGVYILSICRAEAGLSDEEQEYVESTGNNPFTLSRAVSAEHDFRRSGSQGEEMFNQEQSNRKNLLKDKKDKIDRINQAKQKIHYLLIFFQVHNIPEELLYNDYSLNIILDSLLNKIYEDQYINSNLKYDEIFKYFIMSLNKIFVELSTKYNFSVIRKNLDNYYRREMNDRVKN